MRLTTLLAATLLAASPVFAASTDPVVVYPYSTSANFCPAGLQPVSVDGTVSCGKPTTEVTYQQATSSPGRSYTSSKSCPIGVKGC